MSNETRTITLNANDCTYLSAIIRREIDAMKKRAETETDKHTVESAVLCEKRLQNIYDMLCSNPKE